MPYSCKEQSQRAWTRIPAPVPDLLPLSYISIVILAACWIACIAVSKMRRYLSPKGCDLASWGSATATDVGGRVPGPGVRPYSACTQELRLHGIGASSHTCLLTVANHCSSKGKTAQMTLPSVKGSGRRDSSFPHACYTAKPPVPVLN